MSGLIRMAATLVTVASLALAAPLPQATAGKGWKPGSTADTCYLQTPVVGSPTASAVRFGQGVFQNGYYFLLVGPKGKREQGLEGLVMKIGTTPPAIQASGSFTDLIDANSEAQRASLSDDEAKRVIDGEPVVLALPHEAIVNISTVLLSRAAERLAACREERVRALGLDATYLHPPAVPPQGSIHGLFRPEDYPMSALRDGASGDVVIAYVVGTDGRVKECRVIATSHSVVLDRTTCDILKRRGKFTPARDAGGKLVEAHLTTAIAWRAMH